MLIADILEVTMRPARKPRVQPKPKPLPKMPIHPDAKQRRKKPQPFNTPKPLDQS